MGVSTLALTERRNRHHDRRSLESTNVIASVSCEEHLVAAKAIAQEVEDDTDASRLLQVAVHRDPNRFSGSLCYGNVFQGWLTFSEVARKDGNTRRSPGGL